MEYSTLPWNVLNDSLVWMQECLSVAAWFGMEYPHEWLKQYLHGAQPEEVQNAAGPVQMPKHWKQQRMPSQGWRLETVSGDVLQRLQQESKMNFSPFRLLAGIWHSNWRNQTFPNTTQRTIILNVDTAVVWLKGVFPKKVPAKPTSHVSRHWFQLEVLNPENAGDLGHGRDCRASGHNFLRLRSAWRIENHYLWQKFEHETGNNLGMWFLASRLVQVFVFEVSFRIEPMPLLPMRFTFLHNCKYIQLRIFESTSIGWQHVSKNWKSLNMPERVWYIRASRLARSCIVF